ncbi:Uncharacterised protein [Shigella flexneri]|nr:Uncharacterised protein [Shigella flexneri]
MQGRHIRWRGGQSRLFDGERPQRYILAAAKLAGSAFAFRNGGEKGCVARDGKSFRQIAFFRIGMQLRHAH